MKRRRLSHAKKSQRREQTAGSFVVRLWTGQTGRFHDFPRAREWMDARLKGQAPGAYAAVYRAAVARGHDPGRGAPWTEPFHVELVNEYGRIKIADRTDMPRIEPLHEAYPY